jgi:tetratricopeptide (TPR) repeat protein
MASIGLPPRRRLLKAVSRAFDCAGWQVQNRYEISNDFRVDCGSLCLFVKCLDESVANYQSNAKIIAEIERHTQELRVSGHHQLVVVLGRNFLSVPLDSLPGRGSFALTVDDLQIVTGLAAFRDQPPEHTDERQAYLLQRCYKYATFISELHHKKGELVEALRWGRYVVEHSVNYTNAYIRLFELLKEAGNYDEAADLGQKIFDFRPDDPRFLRGMEDLARKRGNRAEAAQWNKRLTAQPTVARTLNEILAKQRTHNDDATTIPVATSQFFQIANRAGSGRWIVRFFKMLGNYTNPG